MVTKTATTKKKTQTNPERSKKDAFEIFDGRVKIFRTGSKVWQMQVWINEEKKYVRESLKTEEKDTAQRLAEERYIFLRAKVQSGERVFSIRATELRDRFLEYAEKQVAAGQLSQGRLNNIKTYTKHYIDFVGAQSQIQNIPVKKFKDYLAFRRQKKSDILATVVVNESITIKQMYRWAQSEGLMQQNYAIDFGSIKKPKDEAVRDSFTTDEYEQLVLVSKNWHKRTKDGSTAEQRYYRQLINDFIIVMGNGGFRTQEARLLTWGDIKRIYGKGEETYAEVVVRAETTKVRKTRTFEMRRGDVFHRRHEKTQYKEPKDFVFQMYQTKEVVNATKLYNTYNELIEEVRKKYPQFDTTKTLYCLRHFWITIRILAGMNVYDIAKIAGTSLTQIQKHYDAASSLVTSKKMNKNKIVFDGHGKVVIERQEEGE